MTDAGYANEETQIVSQWITALQKGEETRLSEVNVQDQADEVSVVLRVAVNVDSERSY